MRKKGKCQECMRAVLSEYLEQCTIDHPQNSARYRTLHNRTVGRRLGRVTIDVSRAALMLPSSSSIVPIAEVINESIIHDHAVVERAIPTIDRWTGAIRSSEPMVVPIPVGRHHRSTRSHWHARSHRRSKSHPSTPVVHCQRYVAPRAGYGMASTNVAPNQLVATPWTLHHLDGLAVCEATVALWTGEWRCNQGLVGLSVWTTQEVGEEATGLGHRDPGVSACRRIVEGTTAHLGD